MFTILYSWTRLKDITRHSEIQLLLQGANLSAPCILSATALPPSKSLECMPAGGETPLNPMIFPEPSDYTGLAKVIFIIYFGCEFHLQFIILSRWDNMHDSSVGRNQSRNGSRNNWWRSYTSAFALYPLHLYRPSYIVNPDFLSADV